MTLNFWQHKIWKIGTYTVNILNKSTDIST